MDNERHSKTFAFEKVMLAVQFVEEVDRYHYTRVWHDNNVRITATKDRIDHVDTIAAKFGGISVNGDKGKWKNTWK